MLLKLLYNFCSCYGPRSESSWRVSCEPRCIDGLGNRRSIRLSYGTEAPRVQTRGLGSFNCAGTDGLCPLRRNAAVQARRGHHRDAGGGPEILEGDPARPREVHLPGLREDQSGPGTLPRHRPRLGWTEPAGDGAVREVWSASAAQPASGALCLGLSYRIFTEVLRRQYHRQEVIEV
jgi:hypothetical protein